MFFFLTLLEDPEEQQKFTEIYYQYRHFLWYVANQKLQDAHLAEDAVQETFLALTRHLDKVEEVHSDRTRNFLATIWRKAERRRYAGSVSDEGKLSPTGILCPGTG